MPTLVEFWTDWLHEKRVTFIIVNDIHHQYSPHHRNHRKWNFEWSHVKHLTQKKSVDPKQPKPSYYQIRPNNDMLPQHTIPYHTIPYHTTPHNTMLWCTAYHTWDGIPCCTLSAVSLQCIIPCCIRSGQKLPNHPQHNRHPMQNRGQTMSKRELLRTTRHYQIGPIRGRWTSRECNGRSPLAYWIPDTLTLSCQQTTTNQMVSSMLGKRTYIQLVQSIKPLHFHSVRRNRKFYF